MDGDGGTVQEWGSGMLQGPLCPAIVAEALLSRGRDMGQESGLVTGIPSPQLLGRSLSPGGQRWVSPSQSNMALHNKGWASGDRVLQ